MATLGDVLLVLVGFALIVAVLDSAVRTFVLPRGVVSFVTRVVFRSMRRLFGLITRPIKTYEARDGVMAMYAPVSLVALVAVWMVLVILGREIIITGLRGLASTEGIVIPASNLGKFKTIFQLVAIIGLLLHSEYHWFFSIDHPLLFVDMHHVGMFYLWIATIITIWSAVDYLRTFVKVFVK